uniref:Uncharacterized protein n=2 Tax=Hucho hucho TaxID=62062 RepID=A0A4W5MX70_9TELE
MCLEESLDCFLKLKAILRNRAQLSFEMLEDPHQTTEWLIRVTPTDPQSLRYSPSNIDVIEWLGAYYIDTQFCEKAIQYFERATFKSTWGQGNVQSCPCSIDNLSSRFLRTQVKWEFMVTSCYRINCEFIIHLK